MSDWNHEKALVRGQTGIDFNLAIGEPRVVRDELTGLWIPEMNVAKCDYPAMDAEKSLLGVIQGFNLQHRSDCFIVPTMGAKHALHAALYALTQDRPLLPLVSYKRPYWVSYPTIAKYAMLDSAEGNTDEDSIEILAIPNNPDGECSATPRQENCVARIWDAAYASPIYGWNGRIPAEVDISVWSGGKLTGLPGLRVGWLATRDENLAAYARQYVEQTTSGVPQYTQELTASAFKHINVEQRVCRIQKTLSDNSRIIGKFLSKHFNAAFRVSKPGMFYWGRVPEYERLDKALKEAKVAVLSGEACGMKTKGWYRWSLGQPVHYTRAAIKQLEKNL